MKKILTALAAAALLVMLAVPAAAYIDTDTIKNVQSALNERGFDSGSVDGLIGARTTAAIKAYQESAGLGVDGLIGEELLSSLGIEMPEGQPEIGSAPESSDFYNLLIVGSDRRDTSWNGNSDAIILMTVNKRRGTVYFTSFMRDMGVEIPGRGLNKINYSYAVEGAPLLKATLEQNFGVRIDNCAAADWAAAAQIVDLFGGVDMEIKDYEINMLNSLAADVAASFGGDAGDPIEWAGTHHLNGCQAVGFARIRKVGNNDAERTERQRRILLSLIKSVDADNSAEAAVLINKILSYVEHDFGLTDVLALTSQLSDIMHYDMQTLRVPFDNMFGSQGEMYIPVQPATSEKLLATIYGD